MKIQRRGLVARDQTQSVFSAILWRLCDASGVPGAALVDAEGETVDYAGRIAPFDLRVAAAEWRLLMSMLQSSSVPGWAEVNEILIRSRQHSFGVWALDQGYALVLVLPRRSFGVSKRALAEAAYDLAQEAGFELRRPVATTRWLHVDVQTAPGDSRRPLAIWQQGAWRPLTVVGRFSADLAAHEIGYLARVASGADLILVRERLGNWFAGSL